MFNFFTQFLVTRKGPIEVFLVFGLAGLAAITAVTGLEILLASGRELFFYQISFSPAVMTVSIR